MTTPARRLFGGSGCGMPTRRMKVRIATSLDALPESFERLFGDVEVGSVFQSRTWFDALIERDLEPARVPRIIGIESYNPSVPPQALLIGTVEPGLAGPPGLRSDGFVGLTTRQSFRAALVLPAELRDPHASFAAVFRSLRALDPRPHHLELELLDLDEALIEELRLALRAVRFVARIDRHEWNRWEDVSDGDAGRFDKKSVRRRERKLRQQHAVRIELSADPERTEALIDAYEVCYARTWKQPEAARPFVRAFLRRAARRGWLRIAVMWVDERPAAAELFLVHRGVASSFKTAYDLALKEYAVGNIVLTAVLRHVIEVDRVREIDFGPGDEAYKHQWMSRRRPLWRVRAFDETTASGRLALAEHDLRAAAWQAAARVRPHLGRVEAPLAELVRSVRPPR